MPRDRSAPFAHGSVALQLAPSSVPVAAVVAGMLADAELAERVGFDGVLVSEHHAGLAGYLPNPLQFAGWVLGSTARVWAAPCPLLLPLRPTGIVAEEAAWLAVRFPGRLGLGVAVGAAPADFAVAGAPFAERAARYRAALPELAQAVSGRARGELANDPAIAACAATPIPVVSATTTRAGVRLAAASGTGIMLDGLSPLTWSVELVSTYRSAGGRGPVVLSRRAWCGAPPATEAAADVERYRSFTPAATHQRITGDDSLIAHAEPAELARRLHDAIDATQADCLSVRMILPGVDRAAIRDQIARFGDDVLPLIRNPN